MTTPKPIVLVTGAFGFLGLHVCRRLAAEGFRVRAIDLDTYAAVNLAEVLGLEGVRHEGADIADASTWDYVSECIGKGPRSGDSLRLLDAKPVAVIHLAAETHVDRSLGRVPTTLATDEREAYEMDALERFWRTNAIGTARVARWCAENAVRMVHLSTDEVLGDRWVEPEIDGGGRVRPGYTLEADTSSPAFPPGSPYAASKVAAEAAVLAEVRCFGLDAVIVRPSNLYGPGQATDKLIPVAIRKLVANENVPLYGDGKQVREWVHVRDVARLVVDLAVSPDWRAISLLPTSPACGIVHAGGGRTNRIDNRHLAYILAARCIERGLRPPGDDFWTFVPDRPGHDRAYALDSSETPSWSGLHDIEDTTSLDELIDAYGGTG